MRSILDYKYFQADSDKIFHELRNNQYYSDVTLVTEEDKHLRAHKIILSSSSEFFKNILERYSNKNPLIYLKDINYKYLDRIIEFIYTGGQCDIDEPELMQFISVGIVLGVKGLLDEIVNNANIVMKDDVSEVEGNQEVENRSEEREFTSSDNVQEKGNRLINDSFLQENIVFGCNECKAVYTNDIGLSLHIRLVHEGVKYYCIQCDFRSTQRGNLTTHIESVHDGVKYECNQCKSTFTQKGSLRKHVRASHEGVRYDCNQCDYRATRPDSIVRHIKSVHDGVKFDCNLCKSIFSDKSSLRKHIRSLHVGIRYDCNQCYFRAAHQSNNTKHLKSVHDGVKYDCN